MEAKEAVSKSNDEKSKAQKAEEKELFRRR